MDHEDYQSYYLETYNANPLASSPVMIPNADEPAFPASPGLPELPSPESQYKQKPYQPKTNILNTPKNNNRMSVNDDDELLTDSIYTLDHYDSTPICMSNINSPPEPTSQPRLEPVVLPPEYANETPKVAVTAPVPASVTIPDSQSQSQLEHQTQTLPQKSINAPAKPISAPQKPPQKTTATLPIMPQKPLPARTVVTAASVSTFPAKSSINTRGPAPSPAKSTINTRGPAPSPAKSSLTRPTTKTTSIIPPVKDKLANTRQKPINAARTAKNTDKSPNSLAPRAVTADKTKVVPKQLSRVPPPPIQKEKPVSHQHLPSRLNNRQPAPNHPRNNSSLNNKNNPRQNAPNNNNVQNVHYKAEFDALLKQNVALKDDIGKLKLDLEEIKATLALIAQQNRMMMSANHQ